MPEVKKQELEIESAAPTMRQMFAMHALTGAIMNRNILSVSLPQMRETCEMCWKFADAMIKTQDAGLPD